MSKLPKLNQFWDFSDYGRPVAKVIALSLVNTSVTPIQVTIGFVISGVFAIVSVISQHYWLALFFLILKSILDAADGELARLKKTPSHTGRYFDSVSDILLNLLILLSIWYVTRGSLALAICAFIGVQLQGTLYNYYYVILRNNLGGDKTSRVFEIDTPIALDGERQSTVNLLYGFYTVLYGLFDQTIYTLDRGASEGKKFPNWLMTLVSTFGLGFQLLVIGLFLVLGFEKYIMSFFIMYSIMIPVFILIRRFVT